MRSERQAETEQILARVRERIRRAEEHRERALVRLVELQRENEALRRRMHRST